ncbi:MAG: hypothetical protein HQK89_16900 [Nitrospirae bacterium]|nr:hypothetical protein [Nitrospirota bacterium]
MDLLDYAQKIQFIKAYYNAGYSLRYIGKKMDQSSLLAKPNKKPWHPQEVKRLIDKYLDVKLIIV